MLSTCGKAPLVELRVSEAGAGKMATRAVTRGRAIL